MTAQDFEAYKKSLKASIAKNQTESVFQDLSSTLKESTVKDDVRLLQSRWHSNKKQNNEGVLDSDDFTREENKVNLALLDFITNLTLDTIITAESHFDPSDYIAVIKEMENAKSAFLSTPLASLKRTGDAQKDNDTFLAFKNIAIDIKNALMYSANWDLDDVYFAGDTIKDIDDFHTPEASVKKDFMAIHKCAYFILIYPYKIPSSILVETGYAMCLNKKCLFFTPNRQELPFLLQQADKVFSKVKIREFKDLADIPKMIEDDVTISVF
jgi:hypothetical protein